MDFIIENDRIYALDPSGKLIAEVTFPTVRGISEINHTFVDESLRGQGVAGKLVKLAAEKITSEGNKIGATCSYAVAWFKRHPEYNLECSGPVACSINRKSS
ncbi:MAG: N-acetyltransferase [Muribaculaceae bacterium]|nr:N-acetyltransferase [Muribaculaceae bacterium]